MPEWIAFALRTGGSVLITAIVTLIVNRIIGLPKVIKNQKEAEKAREEQAKQDNIERDSKIAALEAAINALPGYKAQNLQVQTQLQSTDKEILATLSVIKENMLENRSVLNERLDRLERREKNTIRAKLLDEYRLFSDASKNPMLAWTEMEHHAFFKLVEDYEDLGGNDYVHSVVLPAMNALEVIPMSNKPALLQLMNSRKL